MDNKQRQPLKTEKSHSKKYEDPPVHENNTLQSDVKRKREEIKNSTIGGF